MRLVRHLRRQPGDGIVVAVAIAGQIDVWAGLDDPPPGVSALALAWTLVLLARRRFPLAAPLATWALIVVGAFVWESQVEEGYYALLAGVLASYWIGAGNERRRAVPGGLVAFALAEVVTREFAEGVLSASDAAFIALLVGVPVTVGQAFRGRAEQSRAVAERAARAAAERLARERSSIASERGRIARELHDVVGHSISVMTIQAGAARLLLDRDPAEAEGPLTAIEETGRETLAELRRLVGVLGEPDAGPELAPQPGLTELDRLLENVRAAGLPVELSVVGTPVTLSPGLDLATYRIVQEALTNAIKHSRAARAVVNLHWQPETLDVEITNDGPTRPARDARVGGHGLVGMRERVALYHGTLEVGPTATGFRVHAAFPLEAP